MPNTSPECREHSKQAGLLTPESSFICTFPVSQWHFADIVIGYSGGTVPEFHRTSLLNFRTCSVGYFNISESFFQKIKISNFKTHRDAQLWRLYMFLTKFFPYFTIKIRCFFEEFPELSFAVTYTV